MDRNALIEIFLILFLALKEIDNPSSVLQHIVNNIYISFLGKNESFGNDMVQTLPSTF